MASPTELARQAQQHSEDVKRQLELLKQVVELGNLPAIQSQLATLEARLVALEKFDAEIRRVAVIDDRVNKLEEREKDSGKRLWQFVYIVVGAVLALAASFAVQLVFYFIKK